MHYKENGSMAIFSYAQQSVEIRTEIKDGEPWFAAADVCKILEIYNSRQALIRLEEDEKGVINTDTLGGRQNLTFVNESGLYNLIFQSRKPEARKFRKWVTAELLPSIRKTGSYALPNAGNAPMSEAVTGKIYELLRKIEEGGHLWISAVDLLVASGKGRSGSFLIKCKKMLAEGNAKKIYETRQEKWFIREDAVDEFLGVKPHHKLRNLIAGMVKKGGRHV